MDCVLHIDSKYQIFSIVFLSLRCQSQRGKCLAMQNDWPILLKKNKNIKWKLWPFFTVKKYVNKTKCEYYISFQRLEYFNKIQSVS